MKIKLLLMLVIISALVPGGVGVYTIFDIARTIKLSNNVKYSLEERLMYIDQIIENIETDNMDDDKLIAVFSSLKDVEVSGHEFGVAIDGQSRRAVVIILFCLVIHFFCLWAYLAQRSVPGLTHRR